MIWTDSFGEGTTLNKQKRADLLLVMVTFFWGASYYLTNLCLTDLQPMNLNAFRFLSAFAVLGVVFRKRLRRISRVTLCYTLLVGLALTGTYVAYGYGVSRTSVSNAAFICALPVVVTPIFDFFFCHKKPGRRLLFSLAICTAGLALMTLNDGLRPASGDLICLIVPVCYAVDLLLTERAVRDPAVDPLTLGVCQLGVVGVLTLGMSLLIERPHLPTTAATWAAALFLGLLCSGVAFVVQTVQQQYTTASHVGLIFTLEPVFASIVAFVLGGERLPARGYVGAALMLLSLVMMEVDLDGLLHKKTPPAAAFDGKGALYAAARPDYPQALAQMMQERLRCLTEQLGGRVDVVGDYPAWEYLPDSPLRERMIEVYREQYGKEPVVETVHAGLECGLLGEKLPGLDCVSFGPDLTDIHTPRERMHIASVQRTWKLLCEVLKRSK